VTTLFRWIASFRRQRSERTAIMTDDVFQAPRTPQPCPGAPDTSISP
jgi:hypothetical protein